MLEYPELSTFAQSAKKMKLLKNKKLLYMAAKTSLEHRFDEIASIMLALNPKVISTELI